MPTPTTDAECTASVDFDNGFGMWVSFTCDRVDRHWLHRFEDCDGVVIYWVKEADVPSEHAG